MQPLRQLNSIREKGRKRKAEKSEGIDLSIFFISLKFASGLTWHPMESEDLEPLSKRKYSDLFKEQQRCLER